jgi:hypothetical protein
VVNQHCAHARLLVGLQWGFAGMVANVHAIREPVDQSQSGLNNPHLADVQCRVSVCITPQQQRL